MDEPDRTVLRNIEPGKWTLIALYQGADLGEDVVGLPTHNIEIAIAIGIEGVEAGRWNGQDFDGRMTGIHHIHRGVLERVRWPRSNASIRQARAR